MESHLVVPLPPDTALTLVARVAGLTPEAAWCLLASSGSLTALRPLDLPALRAYGLTSRQALRLRDALDLAACLLAEPRPERPQITCARDAARLVLPEMGLLEAEQMRVLLLDTRGRLIAAVTLYTGTIDAITVRVAEVFRAAVRHNARSLIIAHNHPSTDPAPSPEDVTLTRALVQAGKLLDVAVQDHLIVGGTTYTSLRERGLGWDR